MGTPPQNTSYPANDSQTQNAGYFASSVTYRKLQYNGNGNTGGAAPAYQYKASLYNLILRSQGTLTRTGYTFKGWNTAANGTGTPYTAGATYTGDANDVTLYAQWEYDITFDNNGGSGTTISSVPGGSVVTSTSPAVARKTVNTDITVNLSALPARSGHAFLGWAASQLNADAEIVEYGSSTATSIAFGDAFDTAANGNITLYAVWRVNEFTITYDEGTTKPVTDMPTPNPATKIFDVPITVIKPKSAGLLFLGWKSSNTGTIYSPDIAGKEDFNENAVTTLTAQWEILKYPVTFVEDPENDGDVTWDDAPVTLTKTYGVPLRFDFSGNPVKDGYIFLGWDPDPPTGSFRVPRYTSVLANDLSAHDNSPQTLYAIWFDVSSGFTFDQTQEPGFLNGVADPDWSQTYLTDINNPNVTLDADAYAYYYDEIAGEYVFLNGNAGTGTGNDDVVLTVLYIQPMEWVITAPSGVQDLLRYTQPQNIGRIGLVYQTLPDEARIRVTAESRYDWKLKGYLRPDVTIDYTLVNEDRAEQDEWVFWPYFDEYENSNLGERWPYSISGAQAPYLRDLFVILDGDDLYKIYRPDCFIDVLVYTAQVEFVDPETVSP